MRTPAIATPITDPRCEMLNALGVQCSLRARHRGLSDCRFDMPSNEAIERVLAAEREKEREAICSWMSTAWGSQEDAATNGLVGEIVENIRSAKHEEQKR